MREIINSFTIRGKIEKSTSIIIGVVGLVILLGLWQSAVSILEVPSGILPSPTDIIKVVPVMLSEDDLIYNCWQSIYLNLGGYMKAVLISVPLGMAMGIFPFFRSLLLGYTNAARFIPLTAVIGLFITWFGIEATMKINFLAFGIIVYLLPVVVQRVDEIEKVHLQTIYTLGANWWQTIRHVFIPGVISKVFDDIRVITAISWTYIIFAEMVNKEGGVGAMIFTANRQSHLDKVFLIIVVIVLIGFIQDQLFMLADRVLFKHKYVNK